MKKLKKEELTSHMCSFCDSKDVLALFKTELDAGVYSCFKHQYRLVEWEKDYFYRGESREK